MVRICSKQIQVILGLGQVAPIICMKNEIFTFVNIYSVGTAALLTIVPTAVHVALSNQPLELWEFVSTEAFLGVLHSGVFVAFLRTSLDTGWDGVLVRVVSFVGENPGTILVILVAKARRSTVNHKSKIMVGL